MSDRRDQEPTPTAPGYGDQGPAGAGRDGEQKQPAEQDEDEE